MKVQAALDYPLLFFNLEGPFHGPDVLKIPGDFLTTTDSVTSCEAEAGYARSFCRAEPPGDMQS